VLFTENFETRLGIVSGEGLWRWRLSDYALNNNHQAFSEIINKILQYLAVKENKSRFRIYNRNSFLENERIVFDAEVYNSSYELVNEPEIELIISDENGNQFPFVFNRSGQSYVLAFDILYSPKGASKGGKEFS